MEQSEINQRAYNFLQNQRIAAIATKNNQNELWNSHLAYISDTKLQMYFMVQRKSMTAQYISEHTTVSISIVAPYSDSLKQKSMTINGIAAFITGEELKEVFDHFEVAFPELIHSEETFVQYQGKSAAKRFIRITPRELYFEDSEVFKGIQKIDIQ